MTRLLITGATGLLGANACRVAVDAGHQVRAFVRSESDAPALAALGVEPVCGDLLDPASVDEVLDGVEWVLHAAGQISGHGDTTPDEMFIRSNQWAAINVFAAAERAGSVRTIAVSSGAILERAETVNEDSRVKPIRSGDHAYMRSKRAAFYDAMARAARGQDVMVVFPGGIYGPSPLAGRALVPMSFNGTLLMALRGEVERFVPLPVSWSFAHDVARTCLAAFELGTTGARYMAYGRPGDVCSTAAFCNRALAIAGIERRVRDFVPSPDGDTAEFGAIARFVVEEYPDPPADGSRSAKELGVHPIALDDGLQRTVEWLHELGEWDPRRPGPRIDTTN